MSAFPFPAAGHEEKFIGDTLYEYFIRKPAATRLLKLDNDFVRMGLVKGDVVVLEIDRRPHDECFAQVEHFGEAFLCQLYRRHNKWFAATDDRQGRVTEDVCLVGVARCFIKDLLIE